MSATDPAARRAVLVTRPEPGLSESAAALRALGFEPVAAGMLDIAPRALALDPRARWQAVLVTSGHAVAALAPLARADPATALLAVGDATARRAREAGFTDVRSAAGDALALADLCRATLRPGAGGLLLAVGEGQGAPLAARLRADGFRAIRRVAYAQRPVTRFPAAAAAAIDGGAARAALFLSGSAATVFARLLPPELRDRLADVEAIGISKAAAAPIAALPWKRVRVAVRPTSEDVLALL